MMPDQIPPDGKNIPPHGTWHDDWDRVVNRGHRDSLVCYCGEEVACYHSECLALRGGAQRGEHDATE